MASGTETILLMKADLDVSIAPHNTLILIVDPPVSASSPCLQQMVCGTCKEEADCEALLGKIQIVHAFICTVAKVHSITYLYLLRQDYQVDP